MRPRAPRPGTWHPALVFVLGFAIAILLGAVALALPVASAERRWTPFLDALFTSTSAVCVTGLVVVDTGTYWSGWGQAVILVLMQLGGFGFMLSSTLLLLLPGHRVTLRERLLVRASLGGGGLGAALTLARRMVLLGLLAEAAGAAVLTVRFLGEEEAPRAVWWGVFHSVSAFTNAGFDVTGEYRSLAGYANDLVVLLTIAGLIILGGISYTAVDDVLKRRRFVRLALDTKLVLVTTAALLVLGTLAVLLTEWNNRDTLGGMDGGARVLNGFFHAVVPRTAGFSTLDIGRMTEAGLVVQIPLMFIGGASGSTAGGIKVQTFSLLFFAIVAAVRGVPEVEAFRRRVPMADVLRAIAIALLAIAVVFSAAFALTATEGVAFVRVLYEAVSAFGTVGLSTGLTPETTAAGRVVLILTMFVGRLGPLTLFVALAARERQPPYRWPAETVKIG